MADFATDQYDSDPDSGPQAARTPPLDETVWAWDSGTWWRCEKGAMYRMGNTVHLGRLPTAFEIARGTWAARAAILALEDVLVQHHELDATRRRLVGHLGGEVLINDVLWDLTAERWTLGAGYIVGWRMAGPCAIVMGLKENYDEVPNGSL